MDAPVMVYRDTNTDGTVDEELYLTQDANFNVTSTVNGDSGSVVNRFVYTPYGQRTVLDAYWQASTTDISLGHQGLRLDGETGMYDNRARYYHPTLGRFIQRDPLGYVDGGSLYEYERSEVLRLVDPQGLEVELQGHLVTRAAGSWHLSLKITPRNQALWKNDPRFTRSDPSGSRYVTLGAGPEFHFFRGKTLVSDLNREADVQTADKPKPEAKRRELKQPNCYESEDDWIKALLDADATYGDDLPYGWPGSEKHKYNSNGYISGILDATGTDRPSDDILNEFLDVSPRNTFDMYDRPVPASEFKKQ